MEFKCPMCGKNHRVKLTQLEEFYGYKPNMVKCQHCGKEFDIIMTVTYIVKKKGEQ